VGGDEDRSEGREERTHAAIARATRFRARYPLKKATELVVEEGDISPSEDLGDKCSSGAKNVQRDVERLGRKRASKEATRQLNAEQRVRLSKDSRRGEVELGRIRRGRVDPSLRVRQRTLFREVIRTDD
jgi:hypothetical protein